MPRADFTPAFVAEKDRPGSVAPAPRPFLTAVAHFDEGDLYLADRDVTIGANAYSNVITSWGELGTAIARGETVVEVSEVTIEATNLPVIGQTASVQGRRLSSYFPVALSAVIVDFYQNFLLPGGSVEQAIVGSGIINDAPSYDYLKISFRVSSLMERWLNKPVLPTVTEEKYPFAPEGELGKVIPLAIGRASRLPGVILKGSYASRPKSAAANAGTIALARVKVRRRQGSVTNGSYTIVFSTATVFSVAGESGTIDEDFISSNGQLEILAQDWSGVAEAGDKITFSVDDGPSKIAFSISPAALPVASIRRLCWNGRSFATGVPVSEPTANTSMTIDPAGKEVGVVGDNPGSTGGGESLDMRTGGRVLVQPIDPRDIDSRPLSVSLALEQFGEPSFGFNVYLYDKIDTADWDTTFSRAIVGPIHVSPAPMGGTSGSMVGSYSIPLDGRFVHSGRHYIVVAIIGVNANHYFRVKLASGGLPNCYRYDGVNLVEQSGPLSLSIVNMTGSQISGGIPAQAINASNLSALGGGRAAAYLVKDVWAYIFTDGTPPGKLTVSVLEGGTPEPTGAVLASVELAPADVAASEGGHIISGEFPLDIELDELTLVPHGLLWVKFDGKSSPTGEYRETGDQIENGFHIDAGDWVLGRLGQAMVYSGKWGYWKPFYGIDGSPKSLCSRITGPDVNTFLSTDDGAGNLVAMVTIEGQLPDGVEIIADVEATYSRPDEVAHGLLAAAGVPDERIDLADSFADAGARYASGGYRFDGAVTQQQTYKQLLTRLAFEARSVSDWSRDKAEWKWLHDAATAPAAARTISLADVVRGNEGVPMVDVARSGADEIVNVINLKFGRRLERAGAGVTPYRQSSHLRHDQSISKFGELEKPDLFNLDYVASPAMAQAVGTYWLGAFAWPKRLVNFVTALQTLELEKDDVVDFDLTVHIGTPGAAVGYGEGGYGGGALPPAPWSLDGETFDGLAPGAKFLIVSIVQHAAARSCEYQAREI